LGNSICGLGKVAVIAGWACLSSIVLASSSLADNSLTWSQDSFGQFMQGQFGDSGLNLIATHNGTVETVNRFDLNRDGYLDLVFNNSHDFITAPHPSCYIVPNDRTKSGAYCDLPASGTRLAGVADLNKDGFPDLILAPNDNWVTSRRYLLLYWGDKYGWSGRRVSNLLTIAPRGLQVADLDGDGWLDIVVLNGTRWDPDDGPESVVRIYWGNAQSFEQRSYRDVVVPRARDLKVGDFDGDGKVDLAILQSDPATVLVYWNSGINSKGDFPQAASIDLNSQSASRLAVAGKGKHGGTDFLVSGGVKEEIGRDPTTGEERFRYSGASYVPADGPRSWGILKPIATPPASSMKVADLDNDGSTDIILTDSSATKDSVKILWGGGDGNFDKHPSTVLPVSYASAVAVADLDGDGVPDLIVGVSNSQETYQAFSGTFYGDGKRSFVASSFQIPTADVTDVAIAPAANGTGHRLVFCNNISGRLKEDIPTMVYWGGAKGFDAQKVSKYSLRSGYTSYGADINQDGYADLVIASIFHAAEDNHPGVGFNILWGGPDGLKDDRRTVVREFGLVGLSVADIDRDGYLDLIGTAMASNPQGEPPRLVIWHGGPHGFDPSRRELFPVELIRGQPLVADFNKDGYLDIAIARDYANRLMILWGSKEGYSQAKTTEWPVAAPESMKAADLNGDGWLDLIVASHHFLGTLYFDAGTFIYWGSANGYDPTNVQYLPANSGVGVTVADWDGDGYLDIYLPNYHYGNNRESVASYLYWGSAKGYSDENRTDLMVDSGHGAMAGDFNGDGLIDLAVSCHSRNGTHITNSKVFFNDGHRFKHAQFLELPTIGTHYMQRADVGNIYDRSYRESYISSVFTYDRPFTQAQLQTTADVPGKSHLEWAVRSADSKLELERQPWKNLDAKQMLKFALPGTARCMQYRAIFVSDNGDRYPVLRRVKITVSNR
jgi:hypothetical protein